MPGKREKQRKRRRPQADHSWLKDLFKQVATPVLILIFTGFITMLAPLLKQHFFPPWLQCSQADGVYSVRTSQVRQGSQLRLHPQLVTRYRDYFLLAVYLEGYLEDEYVDLNSGEGTATAVDSASTDELILHIRSSVLDHIEERYGAEVRRQVDANLIMYISTIGGATYVNEGGESSQNICIMGADNIFLNYAPEKQVIFDRLYETKLHLISGSADLRQGGETDRIITALADRIDRRFISKTEIHLADYRPLALRVLKIAGAILAPVLLLWYYVPKKSRLRRNVRKAKRALSQWLQKWSPRKRILVLIAGCVFFVTVAAAAKWNEPTEDERLIYEKMDLAKQTLTSSLFTPRQAEAPQELWPSNETCGRLHLTNKFLSAPLGEPTLDFYDKTFADAYPVSGSSDPPEGTILPDWIDLTGAPYIALKKVSQKSFDSIEEEVEKCGISSRPANLYQLMRALTDAVLNTPELELTALACIAGDALAAGESFLCYKDRQIGEEKEQTAGAEDIALLGVKLYYTLGEQMKLHIASLQKSNGGDAGAWEKYTGYLDCFYAAGFRLAKHGASLAGMGNDQYAKLLYYKGNLGEKLLGERTAPAADPYQQIGEEALEGYKQAEALLLRNDDGTYEFEPNMLKNSQDGISTLEDKAFQVIPVDAAAGIFQ